MHKKRLKKLKLCLHRIVAACFRASRDLEMGLFRYALDSGIKMLLCSLWVASVLQVALSQGSWEVLVQNAGIASMHTAVTHYGNVILLDRTDIGPSQIKLPNGRCRTDPADLTSTTDCSAHSVLFTPGANSVRPLYIATDTWCSSGQFFGDGTLVQTGGDFDGNKKVRRFSPCNDGICDWVEATDQTLQQGRWYATNQILPDGTRQIIVGGRSVFTTEFIPANGQGTTTLALLQQTNDAQNDNYYPFVHLIPDGNLFIFANRDSILYNYATNTVVRTYPKIPGEPRNYPSAGSSVLLPLTASNGFQTAEVLVCGGAQYGAFLNTQKFLTASDSCGRITVTDANPGWAMETMPTPRTMGDMVLLPTGDVLIINGAQNGCQGWGNAKNPALSPVLYTPAAAAGQRFTTLAATTIARVYHSTASLLPDARILLAGSNTHQFYTFTGDFPTELRIEAFSPDYLSSANNNNKPTIVSSPAGAVSYGTTFTVVFSVPTAPQNIIAINLVSSPYTTHSYSQGQRLLELAVANQVSTGNNFQVTVTAPSSNVIAPTAYYMMFAVNQGIPSSAVWVKISN
ncbi:hypothetical protein O6H91_17G038500 [Diphasiastrum complanatum]|uniref:Uncharacterized protein n=2 Tax=Diphasiastrum complanatum TaxID=34168 RepID=A0ACC2B604_DIPCM|nr:hypothetical protein O6H91_Y131500 [Diphasiastrum complanatum]KAJ7525145.1 hypothetical protein O6H91_17G038500 [Diphasiastrum complanatum]